MAKNAKLYFEHHAHDYSDRHVQFYSKIGDYIRNAMVREKEGVPDVSNNKQTIMLLDVGCGNGSFVKSFIDTQEKKTPRVTNNDYYFLATDLSFEMIKLAKQNLSTSTNSDKNIGLFVSYAFNLPIQERKKFDVIHVDSVLHHLVDRSRKKSIGLAKKLLQLLVDFLPNTREGLLIVEEWHFISHVVPTFSSFLIFYGLKLINWLKLDLKFTSEIRRGLEVNFLSPEELQEMLSGLGSNTGVSDVVLLNRVKVKFPRSYRVFLLREKFHTTFILRIHKNMPPTS